MYSRQPPRVSPPNPDAPRDAAVAGCPDAAAGGTVLVLDDSAAQRGMLMALLRKWGYPAVATGDPVLALEMAADPKIGMIVSDWMMPGMTGPELCRRLRQDGSEGYVYVILLTSKSDARALSEGLEAGADDFLTKPVQAPELHARLNAGARIVSMQGELIEKTRSLQSALSEISGLYQAIDTDLEEARRLQMSQVQNANLRLSSAEISQWLRASGHVGGDAVGYFDISAQHLGFFSIDVAGHGVASAMIGARVAAMLSDAAPEQNIALSPLGQGVFRPLPPALTVKRLNSLLLRELQTDRYLTLVLGLLNKGTGKVRMVQAGHPHPMIINSEGQVRLVGEGGLPVGLLDEAEFREVSFTLAPGERLLVYTDGLTECPDPDGVQLEEEGLAELCARFRSQSGPLFLEALSEAVVSFAGTPDLPDDVSALVLDYVGANKAAGSSQPAHPHPLGDEIPIA